MRQKLAIASPWAKIGRKLLQKIEKPQFVGVLTSHEGRQMRVVQTSVVDAEGWVVFLHWLVDEWDGVITDVRYKGFGPIVLLGALESAAEWLMRKNYDEAGRVKEKDIAVSLQDKGSKEDVTGQMKSSIELIIRGIQEASSMCKGIPLPEKYVPTPIQMPISGTPYPGWDSLTLDQQIAVIESVIAEDIRPYIELDAGGIEIVSLTEGRELVIAYKGACTTCYSSVGSTLQAIQQILMDKIHPELKVIPDKSFLQIP
jgi:NifU-like protein